MKRTSAVLISAALFAAVPTAALAYITHKPPPQEKEACTKDGDACNVYCNNGYLAGTMYWNGTYWTDGERWDEDFDKEARAICRATGTDCV